MHIYINECIGQERDAYLIYHGDEAVGTRELRLQITGHFEQAWEHNPKLQNIPLFPKLYTATVLELDGWLEDCQAGHIHDLPVLRLKHEGTVLLWYLSYAPNTNGKTLQSRMSQLCEMSSEMNEIAETRECYLTILTSMRTKTNILMH